MRLGKFGSIGAVLVSAFFIGCGGGSSKPPTPPTPPAALAITTTSPLTAGTINVAYTATLAATGGTLPYTWSSTGTLPTGLTLSSGGVLAGTPTVAASNSFSVVVTDSESPAKTATLAATLAISDGTVTITTPATLPAGAVGSVYSQTLAATGGTTPYTWSVSAGTLPAGLTLSSAGVLSGIPTAAGTTSFTIQATDSASTPQSATLAATLVITPPAALAITTTSPLPPGTVGTAYAGVTFAATGGFAPYTWSIPTGSTIPPGLSLSSSGVLSGTPTSPVGSITVQVADSETPAQILPGTFSLVINPTTASAPIPDGTYAFVFAGTSPQFSPPAGNDINLNGTFTIQSGNVVSGLYDENTNSGPVLTKQVITGGTLTNYSDNLGTLVLNTSPTTSITFALAIPVTGSDIRIIEFDDTTGAGTRGSGILKAATATPALPTGAGSFAFLVSSSNTTQQQEALVCSFQIDGTTNSSGALNIISLKADTNAVAADGTRTVTAFTNGVSPGVAYGSLALDSQGRGLLTFKLNEQTNFHFSFYEVSPTQWFVNSADAASVLAPLATGSVYQQTGSGTFSAASIPASSVVEVSGLASAAGGVTVPDVSGGIGTNAPSGALTGAINFLYDEYNGALKPPQTGSLSYTVDPVSGRVANPADTTTDTHFVLYIINDTMAFILFPGPSANSGILEAQTGSPFSNASFNGPYLGGSFALSGITALNEAGLVMADGLGNFTSLTNQSTPTGLLPYVNVAGTYAVDSTGRVVATAPDGATRLFYVVSPTKVYYLTSEGGGYVGSFEQ